MKPHSDKALWFVIFLNFLFLVGFFIFIQFEISQSKNQSISGCDSTCQKYVQNQIKLAVAHQTPVPTSTPTASPKPAPTTTAPTSVSKSTQITYIPLLGGNSQSTDWTDISGSSFTLNFSDYGAKASAVWDANLRVGDANGTTYVRIFDTTHGIVVNGSEISLSSISVSTDVVSGSLSFWSGNNTYVIQLKSLNSSTAYMDSGKIKITY